MKKKNIIILHTDQQRYDSLGCNGNPHARTPHIDDLAADGIRFTRHISANTACMPSRASFMTGLNVPGHGVSSNGIPLWRRDNGSVNDKDDQISIKLFGEKVRDKIPTMGDVFGENGYNTALFGKLHLQPHLGHGSYGFYESYDTWTKPEAEERTEPYYGFQTHKIILGHGEMPCGSNRGHYGRWLRKKHPEYANLTRPGKDVNTRDGSMRDDIYRSELPSELHNSMWLAEEACSYLEEHTNDEKPTFMFVGFPDPHHPFTPPRDVAEEFENTPLPDFADKTQINGTKPAAVRKAMETFHAGEEDIKWAYRHTAASVHLIDRAVGKIIHKIKEMGLYEDTTIVYTSDHGDFLGDFDMICKYDTPFNNLLHLPFILKPAADSSLAPGVNTTPMSNADVLPTLLSLAGLGQENYMQGIDIFGEEAAENKPMATCYSARVPSRNITLYDDTFRYTYYVDTQEEELYNHKKDPNELANLAFDPTDEIRKICDDFKEELFRKHIESDLGIFNHYALW